MSTQNLFHWLSGRGAGVLLHPTALPGNQGVGTFESGADRFLDFLQAAGMGYWQICPLGPTGYGDSPYQCFSAFAGNPYLVDLNEFVTQGLLAEFDVAPLARLGGDRVDFGALYRLKTPILALAFERFKAAGMSALEGADFEEFKSSHASWLDDYALFRALKDRHGGAAWTEWEPEARSHSAATKSNLRDELADQIEAHRFEQFVFFCQWDRVRKDAARRGIAIIGDVPIFVAADSADVWAHPDLFELDPATGLPLAVAGVPPDYFSADGQLWGNPLYRWERHAGTGFAWWQARLRAAFELYDIVRIDHFRGFDEYWRVPLPAANARGGKWTPGPGMAFFRSIKGAFPDAKIIAEDLGQITPAVIHLREETGLPGMAVLQFAFDATATNPYLPHNLVPNSVIYAGTHDNDTSIGWYNSADERTRDHARRYLRVDGHEIGWDLIRASYGSCSKLAIFTLQDILNLGPESRFNTPGRAEGNWQWRCRGEQLERLFSGAAPYLRLLGELYGRLP